jgi:hypothetical protein
MPSSGCPLNWGREFLAEQAARQRQHGYNDNQIHVDTQAACQRQHGYNTTSSMWTRILERFKAAKLSPPDLPTVLDMDASKTRVVLIWLVSLVLSTILMRTVWTCSRLTEKIIHNCGYKSIHADHLEDILLCFNEIILIHKIVVQGWRNP